MNAAFHQGLFTALLMCEASPVYLTIGLISAPAIVFAELTCCLFVTSEGSAEAMLRQAALEVYLSVASL